METIQYRGRVWKEVGTEPYTRKDGSGTVLRVWRSKCIDCEAPITCKTPMDYGTSKAFGLCRCEEHRQ